MPDIPWFKVFGSKLLHSTKFEKLTPFEAGCLFKLWCIASCNKPRGTLPDIKAISKYFHRSIQANLKRLAAILQSLEKQGWLDLKVNPNGVCQYSIHDWNDYQIPEDIIIQIIEKQKAERKSAKDNEPIIKVPMPDSDPVSPQNSEVLPQKCEFLPQKCEAQPSLFNEMQDGTVSFRLEKGIYSNTTYSHISFENELNSVKLPKPKKLPDPRLQLLKDYITNKWLEYRGTNISSVASKVDWIHISDMLKRSRNDPSVSISYLENSFLRFVSSNQAFDRKQSIGYWARNISAYASRNGGYSHSEARRRVIRALIDICPDEVSDSDRKSI